MTSMSSRCTCTGRDDDWQVERTCPRHGFDAARASFDAARRELAALRELTAEYARRLRVFERGVVRPSLPSVAEMRAETERLRADNDRVEVATMEWAARFEGER